MYVCMALLVVFRFHLVCKGEAGTSSYVDTFLTYFVIQIIFISVKNGRFVLSKFLELLGKHSFNIFLFHTFLYAIYFSKYIYLPKYPIIILPMFLTICLLISFVLDKIKSLLLGLMFKGMDCAKRFYINSDSGIRR